MLQKSGSAGTNGLISIFTDNLNKTEFSKIMVFMRNLFQLETSVQNKTILQKGDEVKCI